MEAADGLESGKRAVLCRSQVQAGKVSDGGGRGAGQQGGEQVVVLDLVSVGRAAPTHRLLAVDVQHACAVSTDNVGGTARGGQAAELLRADRHPGAALECCSAVGAVYYSLIVSGLQAGQTGADQDHFFFSHGYNVSGGAQVGVLLPTSRCTLFSCCKKLVN